MALGYSAQDDADRLAHDPAFKMAVWNRRGDDVIDKRLASQPRQSRLVDIRTLGDNRKILRNSLFDSMRRFLRTARFIWVFV